MDRYYQALHGAVTAHGGTVVKLLGDGVMAAFGVPRVAEDDAMRAVRAARRRCSAPCARWSRPSARWWAATRPARRRQHRGGGRERRPDRRRRRSGQRRRPPAAGGARRRRAARRVDAPPGRRSRDPGAGGRASRCAAAPRRLRRTGWSRSIVRPARPRPRSSAATTSCAACWRSTTTPCGAGAAPASPSCSARPGSASRGS